MTSALAIGRPAVVVACAMLAGCANLDAVRDFASASARFTAYRDATDRYATSADRVLAEVPGSSDFAAARREAEAQSRAQHAERDSLIRLRDTATGYLAALARLAGDDAFDVAPDLDRVTGQLARAPSLGIDDDHVRAYGTIVAKVGRWTLAAAQAKNVRTFAHEYGPAMDTLLGAMEVVARSSEVTIRNEAGSMRGFQEAREVVWSTPLRVEEAVGGADREQLDQRREAVVAWSRRGYVLIAAEEADAIRTARAAARGAALVRAGHAEMLAHLDDLDAKQLVAVLRRAAADLRDVRSSFGDL